MKDHKTTSHAESGVPATELVDRASTIADRFVETPMALVVAYGGGPANQYGLETSGAAVVTELAGRGINAVQLAANTAEALHWLLSQDPSDFVVWVTDPYCYTDTLGGEVRSDLREALADAGLSFAAQTLACSEATLYKDRTAAMARELGIPTIPAVVVPLGASVPTAARQLLGVYSRVIVKPTDGDEGQGVGVAESLDAVADAVTATHRRGSDALVERFVDGVEIGVPVLALDGQDPIALPSVEVRSSATILDHRVKNTPGGFDLICPPQTIAGEVVARVETYAVRLAARLGAQGLIRVDFIVEPPDRTWFLEANSFPGLSPTGLAMASLRTLGLQRSDIALLLTDAAINRI